MAESHRWQSAPSGDGPTEVTRSGHVTRVDAVDEKSHEGTMNRFGWDRLRNGWSSYGVWKDANRAYMDMFLISFLALFHFRHFHFTCAGSLHWLEGGIFLNRRWRRQKLLVFLSRLVVCNLAFLVILSSYFSFFSFSFLHALYSSVLYMYFGLNPVRNIGGQCWIKLGTWRGQQSTV